jgi:hypothetical protein
MRGALFVFSAGLLLLAQVACTHSAGSGDAPPLTIAASEPTARIDESRAKGAVIGTVVTHDAKVSILARGGELQVVVRKLDGAIVADGVSIDELRATDPALHAIVTSAVASRHGETYLDATLDRAPASPGR